MCPFRPISANTSVSISTLYPTVSLSFHKKHPGTSDKDGKTLIILWETSDMTLPWPRERIFSWEYPMPPLPDNSQKGEQTIITLGLELEFLLLNLRTEDDPHAIVRDALEGYGRAPFDTLGQIIPVRSPSLPEVRCDIRLDRVTWFPHGKYIQKTTRAFGRTAVQLSARYNRKHFNVMNEYGLDPLREVGVFGSVQEVVGVNGEVRKRASMEVSTPIMREGSWRRVVPNMLDSLWALGQSRLEIAFNKNTGLHVHVGRRGGWSVCQLKKILKAVVIFEEAMDAQHPASRVRRELDRGAVNILSNIGLMKIGHLSKLERVRYVDSRINSRTARTRAEGVMCLCILTNGHNKCTKYNFLPVRESGTVEFRQGIASLDRNQVGYWIVVVLDFVNAAITTTRKEFERWAVDTDDGHAHIIESFLAHGREYRLRSTSWSGDFEDELLEGADPKPSQVESLGVQPEENTSLLEENSVSSRKGKGVSVTVQKLRNNYEESGRGRNRRGKGESSKTGAQYHENIKLHEYPGLGLSQDRYGLEDRSQ